MTNQVQVSNEVLTLDMCREKLRDGWELHVVCAEDPVPAQNTVRGSWYLVAFEPETGRFGVVVTQRDLYRERRRAEQSGRKLDPSDYAYKEIKTTTGLFNAQMDLGITATVIPGAKGITMVARL
ncbi:hypothetical protein [Paracoccus beibuensis]|uniref:hypothetical protein n=1 Tax=Paracoccus beibuensis TaxID=547602 RepID=UPI0022406601|nr:hypothetical protein [Paracoccus beibuensis]